MSAVKPVCFDLSFSFQTVDEVSVHSVMSLCVLYYFWYCVQFFIAVLALTFNPAFHFLLRRYYIGDMCITSYLLVDMVSVHSVLA